MPESVAASVFELIHAITSATAVRDVWEIYQGAGRKVGLDYGIACFLPDDPLMRRNHMEVMPFEWSMDDYGVHDLVPNQILWRADNAPPASSAVLQFPIAMMAI